jgi:hypothetical protein
MNIAKRRLVMGSGPYDYTAQKIGGTFGLNCVLIIIIFINCNWVFTRWQWLIYMYTIAAKFASGGSHEKHVVATWNLGNHLSICF